MKRQQRARVFGDVIESVGEVKWDVRWDGYSAIAAESAHTICVEKPDAGREPNSAASAPRGQVVSAAPNGHAAPFVPPRATASDSIGGATNVTCSSVSDTGTPTELPAPTNSLPPTAPIPGAILAPDEPSPDSQDSLPDSREMQAELDDGESTDDQPTSMPEQDDAAATEDAAWIAPPPGTSMNLRQSSKTASWTVVNFAAADKMHRLKDTTAQREAHRTLPPGLLEGLPIGDGNVDMLKLWLTLYPGDIEADLERVNASGLRKSNTHKFISLREYVRFWGLVLAGSLYSQQGQDLWATNITFDGIRDQPDFQRYMPLYRFMAIKALVNYAQADFSATVSDPWSWFRRDATELNSNRRAVLSTGLFATMDESMSAFQPRKTKLGGMPNFSFIYRKPKPLGTEFKVVCDCSTGVMTHIEIHEGRDAMRQKPGADEHGVTTARVLRMAAEAATDTDATLLGDAWFGSVAKQGRHFVGCLKTAHSLFPKAFLQSSLQSAPAGSMVIMSATVDEVDLLALGYKYNSRKVLFFVATAGAGDLADGVPYVQRWADDYYSNTVTKSIPRHGMLSTYFEWSPRVYNHNHSRQHDMAPEEAWLTQDCWFRLATTLMGFVATDC
eukprot:jgi/Tetstr1/426859/TSEL_017073.t1